MEKIIGTIIAIFGIADYYYLIKNILKYRQLNNIIEFLSKNQHLNVSQLIKIFQNKSVGHKIGNVIVKGIIKSKNNKYDKNILSAITSIPIKKTDQLRQYVFQRIPYRDVIAKAFWVRPSNKSKISFNLQDLNNLSKISVQSCKDSDISGILNQVKVFQVQLQSHKNKFVRLLSSFFDTIIFLSPFKFMNKIGEKISYYGIMDDQFGYVVGQAKKMADGNVVINNPKYITKQIAFLINRMKQNRKIYRMVLIFYIAVNLITLYYIGKWTYQKYGKKIKIFTQQEQKQEQNVPFHQLCIVCYFSSRSVIFKPCKHYGVCFGCYQRLAQKVCPVCKEPIQGIIRVIKK